MLADCCECGHRISTDAKRCSNCGYDYRDEDVFGDYASEYVENESGSFRRMSRGESRTHCKERMEEYYRKQKEEKEGKERMEKESLVRTLGLVVLWGLIAIIILKFSGH